MTQLQMIRKGSGMSQSELAKKAEVSDGTLLPYDEILIAAGSSPFVPRFEGLDTVPKKYSFMTIDDALALEQALTEKSRVLIVGAGLIGLKCAEGILERVGSVSVCDLADRVLSSILDSECAAMMQKHLEAKGMRFYLSDSVARFEGNTAHMQMWNLTCWSSRSVSAQTADFCGTAAAM